MAKQNLTIFIRLLDQQIFASHLWIIIYCNCTIPPSSTWPFCIFCYSPWPNAPRLVRHLWLGTSRSWQIHFKIMWNMSRIKIMKRNWKGFEMPKNDLKSIYLYVFPDWYVYCIPINVCIVIHWWCGEIHFRNYRTQCRKLCLQTHHI